MIRWNEPMSVPLHRTGFDRLSLRQRVEKTMKASLWSTERPESKGCFAILFLFQDTVVRTKCRRANNKPLQRLHKIWPKRNKAPTLQVEASAS
jgi:hypothetical protein